MDGRENFLFSTVVLPTRPQPDTLVAIFVLKQFGRDRFPGVENAKIEVWQILPAGESESSLLDRGVICIDIGSGAFDHHSVSTKTTATDLVAGVLGVSDDPALTKLFEYARRDDFFGKGTMSNDPLDRAFGLSGLIAALNRDYPNDPHKISSIILPLIYAHYHEEHRRVEELPREFEAKRAKSEVETFTVQHRGKKLSVVILESSAPGMAGYLRSQSGGRFDVVVQWLASGHVNILTRQVRHINLRSLAMLLRLEEANRIQLELNATPDTLAGAGRLRGIPEWYYDPATNTIQNGGINPQEVPATKIPRPSFVRILELGLSEQLWSPHDRTQASAGRKD